MVMGWWVPMKLLMAVVQIQGQDKPIKMVINFHGIWNVLGF